MVFFWRFRLVQASLADNTDDRNFVGPTAA
jgi:hypothetical protein